MSEETENNIGEQFSKAEHYVAENRKSLLVIGGTIVALVLIYFSYQKFIMSPREKEAAALLGIPYEKVTQGGLFPIA